MTEKKVMVFDLDGVIVDSIELICELVRGTFPNINHEEIRELHKGNIHEKIKASTLPRTTETEEEFKVRFGIFAEKKLKSALYPGMAELITELSKNNILAINTSAESITCMPLLEANGIFTNFDFIGTKETHRSKTEKFRMIAEKYGKKPSELLFITDTVGDLLEAYAANVPTIVVTWGLNNQDDFKDVPTKHLVGFAENSSQLLDLINTN